MIDRTISQYRITGELGSGGMGVVYEALDTKLDRTVALKFLPPDLASDDVAKARLVAEAKAASALDHPNVCTIYEIAETADGRLYMAMARYDGETLEERVARGPLPTDEAVDIARQVATGLAEAHASGIVHRDIKPANIFVTASGLVKILDFGLAKLEGSARLTTDGSAPGTICYMSPEQARGEDADARTDVWSLGVVIHEMLSGKLPFMAEYKQAAIFSILYEEPSPLAESCPGAPPWLVDLLTDCLRKDKEKRPADAGRVLAALAGEAPAGRSGRRRTSRWPGSRFRIPAAALLSVAAVVLLVRLFDLWPQSPGTEVILASLDNRTGDTGLGPLVEEGLAIGLQQSRHVRPFVGEPLRAALRRMGMSTGDTIDAETACELAIREDVPAVLATTVSRSGAGYTLAFRIIDSATRAARYSDVLECADAEHLVRELDAVVGRVRKNLGESYWSILRNNVPLEKVTTSSFDALRFYSLGQRETDTERAITLLGKAVQVDSTFAMAHARLAREYFYSAETDRALLHSRRAFELRGRLPLREKLYVEGEYHRMRSEYGEAVDSMLALLELEPENKQCRTNLIHAYIFLIQYGKALDHFERLDEEFRSDPRGHHTLGILLGGSGRYAEAADQLRQAIEKSGGSALRSRLVLTTALICDMQLETACAQLDTMLALDTDAVVGARYMVGRTLPALGRYEDSQDYLRQARSMALAMDDSTSAAWTDIYMGRNLAARGDHAGAVRVLSRAAQFWPGDVPLYWLGRELGTLGDMSAAREVEQELAALAVAEPTKRKHLYINKLRGHLAFVQGDFEGAAGFLEACPLDLDARLLLGQAYVALGRHDAGRAQFRFVIENRFHSFIDSMAGVWPLAYYRLGILAQETGDLATARDCLSDLVGYWEFADPDVFELADARRRLGQLAVE